jgi:hypothetical protein
MTEYIEMQNIKNLILQCVPHRELCLHYEDQLVTAQDGSIVGCDCMYLGK